MLNLIVAPYSYCENAEKFTKRIVAFLKQAKEEYAVFFSSSIDEVASNTKQLVAEGENEFVVVGDDVILSTFINSIKDVSKIKFGIVPIKKCDDFATFLGLSFNPIQAIKDILEKNVDSVDYLIANDIKVLNNITIGASAEIFDVINQYKTKNAIAKKFIAKQNLNKFDGVEITYYSRNKAPQTDTFFEINIANGGLSRGKSVNPLSNVKDGLFNFNYATIMDKREQKKYLSMQRSGQQIYDDKTKQHWLNNLKLFSPNKKIKAIIDGKLVTLEDLSITIVENGLKIYKNK